MKSQEPKAVAMRVSLISIAVNLLLSVFKLLAGIFAKSGAMISDSIHSASDVFSTIIVMIGVQLAGRAADDSHQYGHERFECIASIALSIILLETGLLQSASGRVFSAVRSQISGKADLEGTRLMRRLRSYL